MGHASGITPVASGRDFAVLPIVVVALMTTLPSGLVHNHAVLLPLEGGCLQFLQANVLSLINSADGQVSQIFLVCMNETVS